RLPEEVLRLVSRPRPLPAAVQAGARDAAVAGRRRASAVRRRAGRALRPGAALGRAARPCRRGALGLPPDLDLRRRLTRLPAESEPRCVSLVNRPGSAR